MKLMLAGAGAFAGVLLALTAAALWHWQLAAIMVGLFIAYLCATQVNVDAPRPSEPPAGPPEDLLEEGMMTRGSRP